MLSGADEAQGAVDPLIEERDQAMDPRARALLDGWAALKSSYSGDELVTRTYALEEVERAFQDLRDGKLARGVLRIA